MKREVFSSRLGFILAGLGMAVGTGNIWRFPRVAGQFGGSFVLAWLVALFVWSLPLLLVEVVLGATKRKGVVGVFAEVLGRDKAWAGGFVAFVSLAIAFYYSVVTGWCFRYLALSLVGLPENLDAVWESFVGTPAAAGFAFAAVLASAGVVAFGVQRGIERANKVLLPILFGLLVLLAGYALTLPGSREGAAFLFSVDPKGLADPKVWLNAFSQSAWSTGAGWGLLLTYAVYTRQREDVNLNTLTIGLGNNLASILAGLAVIPTVFALAASPAEVLGAGNEGLSFIWFPRLLMELPAGRLLTVGFFAALSAAALSSLISMLELGVRVLGDWGVPRLKASALVGTAVFLAGLPSALFPSFLKNQDWVWGLALLVSGAFFVWLAAREGFGRIAEYANSVSNLKFPSKIFGILLWLIPVELALMLGWWLWQAVGWERAWWNPLSTFSVGTVFLQWALALIVLWGINKWALSRRRAR